MAFDKHIHMGNSFMLPASRKRVRPKPYSLYQTFSKEDVVATGRPLFAGADYIYRLAIDHRILVLTHWMLDPNID